MPPSLQRRSALGASLALGITLLSPRVRACEFFGANLRIFHPWTRATGDEDLAVVSLKIDEVTLADRLIGVQTPVAGRAELGGSTTGTLIDVAIPVGVDTLLTEGGQHIRLTRLKERLEVARSYPLRLVFERAGAIEATLNVDYVNRGFKAPDLAGLRAQRHD